MDDAFENMPEMANEADRGGGVGGVDGVDAESLTNLQAIYSEWLERTDGSGQSHAHRISRLKDDPAKLRLLVDVNQLRAFDPELARRLVRRPVPHMWALQEAVKEHAQQEEDVGLLKLLRNRTVQIGFEGSFGRNHVSPRGLLSSFLRSLVCVEGIITKCTSVKPKVTKSVHWCPATKKHMQRDYRDNTALDLGLEVGGTTRMPTSSVYPQKDADGNPLETEYGLCVYKDHQMVTMQEMPERAPLGQLPRSIDIILDNDLVDTVKPGDRVQIIGVFRALAGQQGGSTSGAFRTVVLANNVRILGKDIQSVSLTPADIQNCRELSQRGDVLKLLGRSLAPSIYGHEEIKQALVLQLLGGEEKNLDNGTHLRGDINMMMVGDPSTAKSQLLRAVLHAAPLAINTTGRGSSGVGLTAAVTSDPETGERRLEAGAMVLADRGVVCIDEFDKMSEADRVAIHEVMEQQTVTIAKAGIHASLNARCSVLAAANPVYGQYDKDKRPQENIGLPDSLLSRFDLLFVVLDQLNPVTDRLISEHVLRAHRYRRPGAGMEPEPLNGGWADDDDDDADRRAMEQGQMWERHHPQAGVAGTKAQEIVTQAFLRKYLYYAKQKYHPRLTDEAREGIAASYASLRSKMDIKTLPVTARSLETIIRLATAHAKARLASVVEECDTDAAMRLVNFAFYAEAMEEVEEEQGEEDEGVEESKEQEEEEQGRHRRKGGQSQKPKRRSGDGDDWEDGSDEEKDGLSRAKRRRGDASGSAAASRPSGSGSRGPAVSRAERMAFLNGVMWSMFDAQSVEELAVADVLQAINAKPDRPGASYGAQEGEDLLKELERANKVMLSASDGSVHRI